MDGLEINAERFWEKVQKGGPDECWPWRAALSEGGTGVFGVRVHGKIKIWYARRITWVLTRGSLPEGHVVLLCGTTGCCNPDHLADGHHLKSKLTTNDVRQIRRRKLRGTSTKGLAEEYGISPGHVRTIVAGAAWRDVGA